MILQDNEEVCSHFYNSLENCHIALEAKKNKNLS